MAAVPAVDTRALETRAASEGSQRQRMEAPWRRKSARSRAVARVRHLAAARARGALHWAPPAPALVAERLQDIETRQMPAGWPAQARVLESLVRASARAEAVPPGALRRSLLPPAARKPRWRLRAEVVAPPGTSPMQTLRRSVSAVPGPFLSARASRCSSSWGTGEPSGAGSLCTISRGIRPGSPENGYFPKANS